MKPYNFKYNQIKNNFNIQIDSDEDEYINKKINTKINPEVNTKIYKNEVCFIISICIITITVSSYMIYFTVISMRGIK